MMTCFSGKAGLGGGEGGGGGYIFYIAGFNKKLCTKQKKTKKTKKVMKITTIKQSIKQVTCLLYTGAWLSRRLIDGKLRHQTTWT